VRTQESPADKSQRNTSPGDLEEKKKFPDHRNADEDVPVTTWGLLFEPRRNALFRKPHNPDVF